jgi:hypothetical protein
MKSNKERESSMSQPSHAATIVVGVDGSSREQVGSQLGTV